MDATCPELPNVPASEIAEWAATSEAEFRYRMTRAYTGGARALLLESAEEELRALSLLYRNLPQECRPTILCGLAIVTTAAEAEGAIAWSAIKSWADLVREIRPA